MSKYFSSIKTLKALHNQELKPKYILYKLLSTISSHKKKAIFTLKNIQINNSKITDDFS